VRDGFEVSGIFGALLDRSPLEEFRAVGDTIGIKGMSSRGESFSGQWRMIGFTSETFDEKVEWLSARRDLGPLCDYFFETSGRLFRHAKADYQISNVAFFHAVIGVERALRIHYGEPNTHFKQLFEIAIEDGAIRDSLFSNPRFFPK
jgi:hypothetical protein